MHWLELVALFIILVYLVAFTGYDMFPKAFGVQRELHAEGTGHPWGTQGSWGEWSVCGMVAPWLSECTGFPADSEESVLSTL